MGQILNAIREHVKGRRQSGFGTALKRAHTGRVSESLSTEQQFCELLVNEWLDAPEEQSDALGRALIEELLRSLPTCGMPAALRARSFEEHLEPIDPLCFGPPRDPSAGRYNRAGQSTLYAGTTVEGLRAEMARYAVPGRHFYYARYRPTEALRLANLTDPAAHAALHLAFDRAERLDADYEAAQRIADVARQHLDGFIVPGVRGTATHHYTNVVVFLCSDAQDWIDQSFAPRRLGNLL